MAFFYFDGNKLRIYEVPDNASFVVDANGYRIYTPIGVGASMVRFDVQRDLWSRFQDYVSLNSWSYIAFTRSGGNFRGFDENGNAAYQTNDFSLKTSIGWKIVPANYPHEMILRGNLFSDNQDSLFDFSRLTVYGVVPRIEGFDSLQTYTVQSGSSGGTTPAQIWNYSDRSLSSSGVSTIVSSIVSALSNNFSNLVALITPKASQNSIDILASEIEDIKDLQGYTENNPLTANPATGTISTANGKKVVRTESNGNIIYTRNDN